MAEAATILRAAGHHAAPIPLAESMLACWLCAACGVEAPPGALTIGPVDPEDGLAIAQAAVSGHARHIPWGRDAAAVALIAGDTLLVVARGAATFAPAKNLAGEPRDHLGAVGGGVAARRRYPMSSIWIWCSASGRCFAPPRWRAPWRRTRIIHPLCQRPHPVRSADRETPGDPATTGVARRRGGGRSVAVESAAIAVAEDRPSTALAVAAAKIRAGEAAGKVAEIAHQVHGAIGFTFEHSLQRLTRRLWSWRDEFGIWSRELGKHVMAAGPDALWPTLTTG
jgi:acyl-CoA dehydrogenase